MAEVDFLRKRNGLLDVDLESIRDPNYDRSKGLQPQMAYDRNGNLVQVGSYPNRFSLFDSGPGRLIAGAAGDLERGIKYGQEGIKTGLTKAADFTAGNIASGIVNTFTDDYGITASGLNTPKQVQTKRDNLDTKFDTPKISEFGQQESLVGRASNWAKDTFNYLSGGNVTDALKNIADDTPDIVPGITAESITDRFNNDVDAGKLTDASQSDVTSVISKTSQVTNSTGEITAASNLLTGAIGTKGDTKTDKLTGAINGFMDKLDTPGFQTALAMHMEAKNGGDVTSVLFEGMKVKKKAKLDAMTSHKNNLIVKKAEFEIIDLINKAGKPEPASKNLTALATSFLTSGKYDLRSADQGTAIMTLTDYAKKLQTVNNRLTESEAFMEAVRIADKAGALTEDAFFDNPFNGFGGEFDATVTLPTPGGNSVNLSALQAQANAQGISIIDAAEQARIAGYSIDQSK